MRAEEALRLGETAAGTAALEQARKLISQGRYDLAVKQLDYVMGLTRVPQLVADARRELGDTYQKWLDRLLQQKQQLETRMTQINENAEKARQGVQQAEGQARTAQNAARTALATARNADATYQGLGTSGTPSAQAPNAVAQARRQLDKLLTEIAGLQQELLAVNRTLAFVQPRARVYSTQLTLQTTAPASSGSPTGGVITTAQQSVKLGQPYEPPLLTGIAQFFRDYWGFLAVGLLVALWALSRLTKG
jgi:prefoldin subunit 5